MRGGSPEQQQWKDSSVPSAASANCPGLQVGGAERWGWGREAPPTLRPEPESPPMALAAQLPPAGCRERGWRLQLPPREQIPQEMA